MSLKPGDKLGPYEILAQIGAGGMGEVYEARDTRIDRPVAVKVVAQEFSNRVEREARALSGLNHPHICTLYDIGPGYLVMELVKGETLAARLKRGRIPTPVAIQAASQIADALACAHGASIVHCDLKPGNIMLTKSGVKVLDFGLARVLRPEETVTLGHVVQGTPAYMAPEQFEGKRPDERSDIYSLGLVLYEMATGRRLRPGESAVMRELPERFAHVLEKCLRLDPEKRWQSAADLKSELDWSIESPSIDKPSAARMGIWIGSVFAAAAIGAAIWSWPWAATDSASNLAAEFSILPPKGVTFAPAATGGSWPVISRDGSQIAFVAARSDGEQQIWVRDLNSSTARSIPGTDGAFRPFWSPDGGSIGYFANGQVWRVDLASDRVRALGSAPYNGGLAGSWGDGLILFNGFGGLRRVPAGGGLVTIVIPSDDTQNPVAPEFLPNGRDFLYMMESRQGSGKNQVCVASIEPGEPSCFPSLQTTVRYVPPGYLIYIRDSTLMAQAFDPRSRKITGGPMTVTGVLVDPAETYYPPQAAAALNGALVYVSPARIRLVWLDHNGAEVEEVGTGSRPTVSPDGQHIVVQKDGDLWHHDRLKGTDRPFTFDSASDGWPVLSSDGREVLFSSQRNGQAGLFRKPLSGAATELPVRTPTPATNPDLSPDRRFVLYQTNDPKTGWDLRAADLSTEGSLSLPVAVTEHGEREGRFSPDGHWVAYDSTESGPRDIWIQPFPKNEPRWKISTGGGTSPRWRGDGRELYYVDADGILTAVAITGGETLHAGPPRRLFQTMFRGGVYASYTPSFDGQRFLINVPPRLEDTSPITVVLNWTSRLEE